MRYFILQHLAIGIMLAGCAGTTNIIDKEVQVIKPSEALYQCQLVKFPDPEHLTDIQVARVLEALAYENRRCYNSLRAIHAFVENADGSVTPNKKMVMEAKQYARQGFIACEVSRSSSLAQSKTPCRLSLPPQN